MTASKAKARSRAGTLPAPEAAVARFARPRAEFFAGPLERLRALIRAEAGAGRLLPWVPVAFGAGIALYFTASHEPVGWVTVVTALGLAAMAVSARHRPALFPALVLATALAVGFATATLRAGRLAHPVLAQPVTATLSGFVETRELRERTDRFVLRVTKMEAARGAAVERVRLSVRKGSAPGVGSFVELKARLSPPTQPLRPGSYDFARDLYFQGIGATGFVLGRVATAAPPEAGGLWLSYAAVLQNIRDAVDARIGAVVSGDARAIATALITGRRDALTTPVNDALFISGLGHVLSISGYHMALVAGVVFFAVRALLALSRRLASERPIKKWAAAVALAAAAFYLALSGAEVATQRSFLMTAIVLVGVMVDRRAITFRTLAIAALAVLALAPESLVHPSFQMSFAATLGLVALVEHGMPKLVSLPREGTASALAAWGGRELTTLTFASLIAGFATMPYAAFHFHRITPYGVLANLAAMPVVSGWVMPAGILGLLAMPFGLDSVFWRLMEWGIDWMVTVSRFVAALPGAVGRVPAFGSGPLIVMTLGIVVMGLMKSVLRWSGAAAVAAATLWATLTVQPDILVSASGQMAAVRGADGRLRVMANGKDMFALREWLAGDGDARAPADPSLAEGVRCDEFGCVAPARDGGLVALARVPAALADDCARASVTITAWQAPSDCAAQVVSTGATRGHATALWRGTQGSYRLETASAGVDRPWIARRLGAALGVAPSQATAAAPAGAAAVRPASRRPAAVDATPDEADRLDPE